MIKSQQAAKNHYRSFQDSFLKRFNSSITRRPPRMQLKQHATQCNTRTRGVYYNGGGTNDNNNNNYKNNINIKKYNVSIPINTRSHELHNYVTQTGYLNTVFFYLMIYNSSFRLIRRK